MNECMAFPDTVEEFMEQYKMVDTDHVYSNGTKFVPIFRMRQWFEHLQLRPITNADRIRAMTDEELAKFFATFEMADACPDMPGCMEEGCEKCWIYWLKQEVKDD